jgi:hypothetical protein
VPRPPNIVLVLADDMGYGDFSCFNGGCSSTPVLDQLVAEGTTLTQHYSASPVCAPARASLLTGRYPHRTGAIDTLEGRGLDRLALDETTVADLLRRAGYVTGLIGKWHNGAFDDRFHPNRRGFDEFTGFRGGWSDYWSWRLDRNGHVTASDGRHLTDVLTTHAKYAPSQRQWLMPLDDAVDTSALAPDAVRMCRFDGALLSVPRCIDVRVLWSTSDDAPATWEALVESGLVFGFPGRESGLFGTFFELVVSRGGRLFDSTTPAIDSDAAVWAVETLCRLAARAPHDLPDWHYDQVDRALLDGRVEAAAAWPGGFGAIHRARLGGRTLVPHPYPGGEAAQGLDCPDRGVAVDDRRRAVEQPAAPAHDQFEERAEQARLPAREAEHEPALHERLPGGRRVVGRRPEHPDVDAARHRQQRAVEAAHANRIGRERRRVDGVVERREPLPL